MEIKPCNKCKNFKSNRSGEYCSRIIDEIIITNFVDGSRYAEQITLDRRCREERSDSWFISLFTRSCGNNARYFEPIQPTINGI